MSTEFPDGFGGAEKLMVRYFLVTNPRHHSGLKGLMDELSALLTECGTDLVLHRGEER